MDQIAEKFHHVCRNPSDINEHCATLEKYARESETILEAGVRSTVSTWAFLHGLTGNNSSIKRLYSVDLEDCQVDQVKILAEEVKIHFNFTKCDILKYQLSEPVDLFFIDTFHVYGQLKRELNRFHQQVRKYIIMHDTTVDAEVGEMIRNGWSLSSFAHLGWAEKELTTGLWPAVEEFLQNHPEWKIKERFFHNHGLTILERIEHSYKISKISNIPVYIIGYNNLYWVRNLLSQINRFTDNINIIDNASTERKMRDYLDHDCPYRVIKMEKNYGYQVYREIWDQLPDQFILTDPDLQLNPKTPFNFIETLSMISQREKAYKVGLALLLEPSKFLPGIYFKEQTIEEWEKQFWEKPLSNRQNCSQNCSTEICSIDQLNLNKESSLEMYLADIDTTFALWNKKGTPSRNIRVAGDFTAKHLPWYREAWVDYPTDEFKEYFIQSKDSTTVKLLSQTINISSFKIPICSQNLEWWKAHYHRWEPQTFRVLDRYLSKVKDFLDIGTWIGPVSLYAAPYCRKILGVECDKASVFEMTLNALVNDFNIEVINRAIYDKPNQQIWFGPNSFNSSWNTLNLSTSQIHQNKSTELDYQVTSITFKELIQRNLDLSLIKIDIEGAEEYLLDNLLEYLKSSDVPVLISFHLTWWRKYSLNDFDFQDIIITDTDENPVDLHKMLGQDPFFTFIFKGKTSIKLI